MISTKTCVSFILLMVMTPLSLISCSNAAGTDIQPNIGIDDQFMNEQISVSAPEYFNSYRTNDPIVLEVVSHSNGEIRFSNDFSLRIFEKTDTGWVEIKEMPITRLPKDNVIFSPSSLTSKDLAVFPDFRDHSQSYYIRIYVIGDMQTEQEIEKVSAYTDIQLQP